MTRLLPALLVGFAAWFVVPRGLALLQLPHRRTAVPAALLTVGLIAPRGVGAAALTAPWCFVAAAIALDLVRSPAQGRDRFGAVTACASVAFLVVGASWATLAAIGADPVHVSDVIVILTAAHFHYAGFAFGAIAARTRRDHPSRTIEAAILLWLAGVPAVALTIASHSTNPAGALALAVAGGAIGGALLRAAHRRRDAGLAVAGASNDLGVMLAAGYASSMRLGFSWFDIDAMERLHGTLNALGFATVGVASWNAIDRGDARREDVPCISA